MKPEYAEIESVRRKSRAGAAVEVISAAEALALMKINLVNDVGARRCRSVRVERAALSALSLFLILS